MGPHSVGAAHRLPHFKVGHSRIISTHLSCVPSMFCASKETDTLPAPWSLCQQLWDIVIQFVFLRWAGGVICAPLCSAQRAGCACPQGPAATGMLRGATRSGRCDRKGQCLHFSEFSQTSPASFAGGFGPAAIIP